MELRIFDISDKNDLYQELKRFQLPYKVKVEPIFQKRTDTENRYYWGIVIKTISEFTGFYTHEIHNILLVMFAKIGESEDDKGREYHIVESTKGMSTMRYEKYLDDIKVFFLTEFKLLIADIGEAFPEDVYTEKFIFKQ